MTKEKKSKKLAFVVVLVVVSAIGIGSYLVFSKSPGTPPAWTLKYVETKFLKNWHKYDPIYASPKDTIACTYNPENFKPGYQFACSIFDGQGVEVGQEKAVTDAPQNGKWTVTLQITPDNPIP